MNERYAESLVVRGGEQMQEACWMAHIAWAPNQFLNAREAFAKCVAIASIQPGDRQSQNSSPSSFSPPRSAFILSGGMADSITDYTSGAKSAKGLGSRS